MAKWKIKRLTYGTEEFTITEGEEVTIGRSLTNTITLSSIVISRNHCVLKVLEDKILITDLMSSNGIYVGPDRIPPNKPYAAKDSDIIGIGWISEASLGKINNEEKFVFQLCRENNTPSILNRIKFQNENNIDDLEAHLSALHSNGKTSPKIKSPVIGNKLTLKRKIQEIKTDTQENKKWRVIPIDDDVVNPLSNSKNKYPKNHVNVTNNIKNEEISEEFPKNHVNVGKIPIDDDVVHLLSDSENELPKNHVNIANNIKYEEISEEFPKNHINVGKIIKLEEISEEPVKESSKDKIKCENDYIDCEAFNVKQEYFGYDDEPIKVDSDSDSESEHWYLRLSQSSPGKPFIRKSQDKVDAKQDDSSYSQMDDDFMGFGENHFEEEEYLDDIIILPKPPKETDTNIAVSDDDDFEDIIRLNSFPTATADPVANNHMDRDEVDACSSDQTHQTVGKSTETYPVQSDSKKTQMIEAQVHSHKPKSKYESIKKSKSSSKVSKAKKHAHSFKRQITNSQKEERRKRLKEIATKGKEIEADQKNISNSSNKSTTINVTKATSSSRGAFLTDTVQIVKPVRKEESKEPKCKQKSSKSPPKPESGAKLESIKPADVENLKETNEDKLKSSNTRSKQQSSKSSHITSPDSSKSKTKEDSSSIVPLKSLRPEIAATEESIKIAVKSKLQETRVPLKSVKPVTESEKSYSGKPFSKVEPLPPAKLKKTVRFSDAAPQIHIFEIEPGNKMKKTSLVKTSFLDSRQLPVFSLNKITLMKILRWNPQWLEEQINNNEPPPILGHNHPPMSTFHSYASHQQYVQMVGDLLLMEIWECLSLAYVKIRTQSMALQMQIGALPPTPTQERCYELFSLSVNISLPSNNKSIVPRVGEIILATFGPENAKTKRFFFVNNVTLPSPPNNIHTFYSVSLHATYTDKMKSLRQGEVIVGCTLAHINNELNLFEAMEHLGGSPLSDAILKPKPRHFLQNCNPGYQVRSEWTKTLNESQQKAVTGSVSAALGDRPSIQMVQGPPGTGKSSVICAMVMTYFYGEQGRRQQNRGKVLICATSNAAVDELVIRLLKIRQNLPKTERFRMVRVGRAEAMHSRARDVSSQQLAQRDAARVYAEPAPTHPGLLEEISHLEAKINMWKTQTHDAKDPVRVAYCQGRISDLVKRITHMKAGVGGKAGEELRPDQLMAAERRIIEGADIVLTTLASALNTKLRGLKRRIALCIIDEAGQAIEPVTLIPLTLDVTRLTLIGDPQQLPGYICSQRAKKHGLGESLFSRLISSAEVWPEGNPVVLLNQQYRMHPDIADYPNRAFYGGKVISSAPERPMSLALPPYAIVSISSGDKGQGSSGSNSMEAWGVSRLVTALNATLRAFSLNLAVITPYNAHKELIKKHMRSLQDPSEPAVEVNTVDGFQGQERDVVVVSLARSQGVGFLTDPGRMNVMLTRAKHALLICLNPNAMLKNHQWRTLVEDAQRRKMFRVLPNKMCQPYVTGAPQDDILKYL